MVGSQRDGAVEMAERRFIFAEHRAVSSGRAHGARPRPAHERAGLHAAELQRALTASLRPGFEVLDAKGQVIASGLANGEPIRLLPGDYGVRPRGSRAKARLATVRSKETTAVQL